MHHRHIFHPVHPCLSGRERAEQQQHYQQHLFEKYKILLAEAKAAGNAQRVAELEQLLRSVDIKKISTDSEAIVNGFSNGLNAM